MSEMYPSLYARHKEWCQAVVHVFCCEAQEADCNCHE